MTGTNKYCADKGHLSKAEKEKFHPKALTGEKHKEQERIKLQVKLKAALVRQKDQSVGMISFDRVRSMYPAKLDDDVGHP